jgi:uncharacterized protein with GYD domain
MPHYLHQVAYSPEGWRALIAQPQDRIEAVRPAVEKLGGKIKSAWFAFGDYDVVMITEMPDNVSAAAIAIRICRRRRVQVGSDHTANVRRGSSAGRTTSQRVWLPAGRRYPPGSIIRAQ